MTRIEFVASFIMSFYNRDINLDWLLADANKAADAIYGAKV